MTRAPARNAATSKQAAASRQPCSRPARRIMALCGALHRVASVSTRMPIHSESDGRWRRSGLADQSAARSSSRNSARPRRVSFCFRVSHALSDGTR